MARIFGTDGIRGVAGTDLTADLARRLGAAAMAVLSTAKGRPAIVLGRDPRPSGPWLESALADGVAAAGGDVLLVGIQTTPAVAHLTIELGAAAGVMLSASHNPPEYNGIKFFGPSGLKLADEVEDRIEAALLEEDRPGDEPGSVRPVSDATERYLRHLVAAAEASLAGMRLVVDCANGSASGVAPDAFRRLGAEVHVLNGDGDGSRINVGTGATHPDVVAEQVVRIRADAGVAHDGDADRAMFADADGNVVDGDQVLAACAIALHEQGRLSGGRVVTTVMANLGFHRCMEEAGIEVVTTKVGDRYVLEEMLRTGAVIGGEQSGHIIFSDHATTGDGILTAIKLLSMAQASGLSIGKFTARMRRYPQVLQNVAVADPGGLEGAAGVWESVRLAQEALGSRGRVLVRPSGTEPLVRVMIEAESEQDARLHAEAICAEVRRELG